MTIVHFKKIPKQISEMINEFENTTLDFWFWGLIANKSNDIINFCAKKYADEIKKDILVFAKNIKIEIALLLNEINEKTLKQEMDKIKKMINEELADIQLFLKITKRGIIYEN